MPLGKIIRIADQELLEFQLNRARRGLRSKIGPQVELLLKDYVKNPDPHAYDIETLKFNLTMVLSRHVGDSADRFVDIYDEALAGQNQKKTAKVMWAAYRKTVVQMKEEGKWFEELLDKTSKVNGVPAGLFTNFVAQVTHDKAIRSGLRKRIRAVSTKTRMRPRGLKVKSKRLRPNATSQAQHTSALSPEQWRHMSSVTQKQAGAILYVEDRTIRNWVKKGKLTRAASGRIVMDEKFHAENDKRNKPSDH